MGDKVIILDNDDLLRRYYYANNFNIYFREGEGSLYEILDGFSLEECIDASTYGFLFVAASSNASTIDISESEIIRIKGEKL